MGAIGDSIGKINAVAPGYWENKNLDELLGIHGGEIVEPIRFEDLDDVLKGEIKGGE